MLVLSRKKNEQIIVGDSIVITVVEVRGDRVRLGIEAPQEIPIHRNEVLESIKAQQAAENPENKSAAVSFDQE
ncbi:MAG TPA: carbon storage regulator CsrA [Planctomycetaceae bacterium]|nr:carbon storage regulator CsrA [Planctomycetaceae bacterium]